MGHRCLDFGNFGKCGSRFAGSPVTSVRSNCPSKRTFTRPVRHGDFVPRKDSCTAATNVYGARVLFHHPGGAPEHRWRNGEGERWACRMPP